MQSEADLRLLQHPRWNDELLSQSAPSTTSVTISAASSTKFTYPTITTPAKLSP